MAIDPDADVTASRENAIAEKRRVPTLVCLTKDFPTQVRKRLLCVRCATVVAVMVVAICGPGLQPAAHNRESPVTWTTDVEPILQRRCIGCHAAGGFGPMPLATYQDARRWAKAIRQEVLERRMPPWPAARGFGDFLNDRSLTPIEVELLTSWADGATPLGPPVIRSGLIST